MRPFPYPNVLIIGATGGLGNAITQYFSKQGITVFVAGRSIDKLEQLIANGYASKYWQIDVSNTDQITELATVLGQQLKDLLIINASGYDVRKPHPQHTLQEVDQSLQVNLRAGIWLTYSFAKHIQNGLIVHLGGFANGYLALPYYTTNVATRAGIRAFCESFNREQSQSSFKAMYFSPSPSNTEAERPYHHLWEQLGTPIISPEQVAKEIQQAILKRQTVYVMGGLLTNLFAIINVASPAIADSILLNQYTTTLGSFFKNEHIAPKSSKNTWIAWLLIAYSFLGYLIAFGLLPFIPLSISQKLIIISTLVATSEIAFWGGSIWVGIGYRQKMISQIKKVFRLESKP